MKEIEDYFTYDYLNQLAIDERIFYSPSVGWDKINSKNVSLHKEKIFRDIENRIKDGKYKFVPYKVNLIIKNKDSKPRKTCIPTIVDRIVISAVKRYLYDAYDSESFNIPANVIINDITKIINDKKYEYYLKIDLTSFFDNINHEILLKKIDEKIENKIILDLIRKMLENPQKCDETDRRDINTVGVPQGISIATLLSNIYMHELDMKYSKNSEICYFRYVDDIIIFANSFEKINEIFNKIKYDLERKNLLPINEKKTKIEKIGRGLEYLGYKFENDLITIRRSSILKFERNLEKVFKNFSLIKEKNSNQIKKFIWLLNVKITGILVDGKKYGWLYYFSCINDITLLKKLDILILKFIKRFRVEEFIMEDDIKKFTKSYFEINHNIHTSKYLLNLNKVDDEEKKKFLREICLLTNVDELSEKELNYRYNYNLYRTLKSLEKDIDSISR